MIWCDVRVLPAVRRLLAALALVGPAVVLGQLPAPAHAAPDRVLPAAVATSVAKDVKAVSDVFEGTVTSVKRSGSGRRATASYGVDVQRVYKGGVRTDHVRVTSARAGAGCSVVDLRPHRRYVFMAEARGADLMVDSCGGTAAADPALVAQVEKVLGDGRTPTTSSSPAPPKAEFTRVGDSRPRSLTRLAAPGGALVLVGLLGLVVVRRLGRRA